VFAEGGAQINATLIWIPVHPTGEVDVLCLEGTKATVVWARQLHTTTREPQCMRARFLNILVGALEGNAHLLHMLVLMAGLNLSLEGSILGSVDLREVRKGQKVPLGDVALL